MNNEPKHTKAVTDLLLMGFSACFYYTSSCSQPNTSQQFLGQPPRLDRAGQSDRVPSAVVPACHTPDEYRFRAGLKVRGYTHKDAVFLVETTGVSLSSPSLLLQKALCSSLSLQCFSLLSRLQLLFRILLGTRFNQLEATALPWQLIHQRPPKRSSKLRATALPPQPLQKRRIKNLPHLHKKLPSSLTQLFTRTYDGQLM